LGDIESLLNLHYPNVTVKNNPTLRKRKRIGKRKRKRKKKKSKSIYERARRAL
jgi:hypothetical protein